MGNGGVYYSNPFSDDKCVNNNTINGSGGSSTSSYMLPWFAPCIGPKRRALPPPHPEQAIPIPLAKVLLASSRIHLFVRGALCYVLNIGILSVLCLFQGYDQSAIFTQ